MEENHLDSDVTGVFDDPQYYKTALSGEGESAQRFHAVFSKYLSTQDLQDKGVFRPKVTTAFWDLVKSIAPKVSLSGFPGAKQMLLRFGVVYPKLMEEDQKQMLAELVQPNTTGEPVFYLDEWFGAIASGELGLSGTDEIPVKKAGSGDPAEDAHRLVQLQARNKGKVEAAEGILQEKETQRSAIEVELQNHVETLCSHEISAEVSGHKSPLNEAQKHAAAEITDRVQQLLKVNKEIESQFQALYEAQNIARSLDDKMEGLEIDTAVNASDAQAEVETVRKMARMIAGRQGNHFPVFTKEYCHCMPRTIGSRENVLSILTWIETVDPGAFYRVQRSASLRIVPNVLIIPSYGDSGVCWEPFDRYNRATSRGRIAVPMYPRVLQTAVLTGVGDLRWQTAKEKSGIYWMEEGLSGAFYQWFTEQKLKGDIKDAFVENYILWLTKESEGMQRLDKDLRAAFWRHIPFSQETKEKLKTRSMAYQELYQRDQNRAMSDGY